MGKVGKKRSAAPGARHRGRRNDAQTPAANPFELLHARKKFNILGKRQKGGPKSKLQARSQANQRVSDGLTGLLLAIRMCDVLAHVSGRNSGNAAAA
jgi:hypothetical protein